MNRLLQGYCPVCVVEHKITLPQVTRIVHGKCKKCGKERKVYTFATTHDLATLIAIAALALIVGACFAGCKTIDFAKIEREIERAKERMDGPTSAEDVAPPKDAPDTPEAPPVASTGYPWDGKDILVDHSTCDGSVHTWRETATLDAVNVNGSVLSWSYTVKPVWDANARLNWAQSNVMLMGRKGQTWDTWYGHWLRYGQTSQAYDQMYHERGRAWPTDYDEVWICIAAPNRAGCFTTDERTNWKKVK